MISFSHCEQEEASEVDCGVRAAVLTCPAPPYVWRRMVGPLSRTQLGHCSCVHLFHAKSGREIGRVTEES